MNSRHQSSSRRTIEPNVSVIFPDGWPANYEWVGGRIYYGISTEFPRVFKPDSHSDLFLVPSSLSCAASLKLLTKAQQARKDCHDCLTIGCSALALLHKKGRIVYDHVVRAIDNEMRGRGLEYNSDCHFKVDCVLSPGHPPKCHTNLFGDIAISKSLTNRVTVIPNVVYVGYVYVKILITNNQCRESGAFTELLFQPELANIVYVKPVEVIEDSTQHFSLLNACPWNRNRKLKGVEFNQSELQPYIIPKPPTRKLRHVVLWYFSGNIVVRANVPKTLVKITEGMQRVCPMLAEKLELKDGECLLATIIYSEFCDCYYVEKYFMITDSKKQYIRVPQQRKLEKREILNGFDNVPEYSVRVHESTQYKGFFTCEPLRNCLIADPKNILRNVMLEKHQEKEGFPVWIRLEKDHHERLSQFSITELNRESGEYSPKEKMMDYPNISGCGILVCLATGTVFSKDHPQKNIRLDPLDKYEVQLGHFFHFNATYWPARSLYLIGNFQPISEHIMQPIPTFFLDNRLLFEEDFDCYCPQASETHFGQTFGPISDPLMLITARARIKKIEWPKNAIGYVGYNADFEPGINSQMMLFNEKIEKGAENVTSEVMLIQGENNYKRCRCYDLWHLVHDIRFKTQGKKGMMNEELWQRLHKLEKKIQPNIEE